MNKTVSIHFHIRRDKIIDDERAPIYLRITIDGLKSELATKRYIHPDRWNAKTQKATGISEESSSINSFLKSFEIEVYNHYQELMASKSSITSHRLKNKILGMDKTGRFALKIFEEHNQQFAALVGDKEDNYAPSTLVRYETTKKHITDYLYNKYKLSDIDIKEVDHEFISGFEFYLRSVRKCNNNSAVKYIKNFKKIIRICIANGWLDKDPFIKFKTKLKEVERTILNMDEVNAIFEKELSNERLSIVRDTFIFSCYTGLAYSDVAKLTKTDIVVGVDGEKWIYINRKKTDTISKIPLLPLALEMIEKYKSHHLSLLKGNVFPILSNQRMNAYLKEIADVCGINKELTFHLARHTFATTITLNNNVPIESVSKMLGHKSLRTTQHYAKVLDKKIGDDMNVLRKRLSNPPEKINN